MENFKICKFGAILADGNVNEVIENSTFMQYGRNIRGVANAYVLVYPVYYLAIQSENIEEIKYTISQGIEYTPFGVQNDYFAKNWSEMGVEAYYDASQKNKLLIQN